MGEYLNKIPFYYYLKFIICKIYIKALLVFAARAKAELAAL